MILTAMLFAILPLAAAQINVMASWGGDEQAGFQEVLDAFTQKTGITVNYEGNRDVQAVVQTRVAGGNPPDVAFIPRPGVVAQLARDGAILPLTEGSDPILDPAALSANYSQAFIDLGTVDGKVYAVLGKANSKSTVWYKPASFEELGVEPPVTWDDLVAITDAYVASGKIPWAIGGLDGWTLTDWFENLYVRVAGPDMYNKLFVTHEVSWTDPTVVQTMDLLRQIIDPADEKLAGGADGTLSTGFIDAFGLVLRGEAEMYYEGGFMSSFGEQNFPNLTCGTDYSFFLFPEVSSMYGRPVVGGGDLAVIFKDNPEVRAFADFITSPEANEVWATADRGAVISPNAGVPLDAYTSPCKRLEAEQIVNADIFVFDGSDLAPSAVGGDAMFTGLQDFLANPDKRDDVLQFIEEAAANAY